MRLCVCVCLCVFAVVMQWKIAENSADKIERCRWMCAAFADNAKDGAAEKMQRIQTHSKRKPKHTSWVTEQLGEWRPPATEKTQTTPYPKRIKPSTGKRARALLDRVKKKPKHFCLTTAKMNGLFKWMRFRAYKRLMFCVSFRWPLSTGFRMVRDQSK